MGDYSKAIADFDQAVRLSPNFPDAFYHRGNVYSEKGYYQQAIADYTQAISLAARFVAAVINRGNAYMSHGDYDLAIQDYDRAATLDPGNSQALQGRVQATLEKAKQASAKGIAIEPKASSN